MGRPGKSFQLRAVCYLLIPAQTFGGLFQSDGRPKGTLDIKTIQCDQNANTCQIKVPAPSVALVFLNNAALSESDTGQVKTFPTTLITQTVNTVTVAPEVLATSNGHSGMDSRLGSTSRGSTGGAPGMIRTVPGLVALVAMTFGAVMVLLGGDV
jgi:hypothetical protein